MFVILNKNQSIGDKVVDGESVTVNPLHKKKGEKK